MLAKPIRLILCIYFCSYLIGCGNSNNPLAEEYFEKGVFHKLGHDNYPLDKKKAYEFFQKAADLGQPDAQYEIGIAHVANINGFPQDESESFKWLLKSAKQINSRPLMGLSWDYQAQAEVGDCYLNGRGVSKDIVEGVAWLIIADKRGWGPGILAKQNKSLTAAQIAEAEKRAVELSSR